MLKKSLSLFLAALTATSIFALPTALAEEKTVLKVASHLPPMTDIVELVNEVIAEPYKVELVEVSDNIQYNEALLNDEVYANFAQHRPFMEMFNEANKGDLVALQPIYNARVGFYAPEFKSIEDIKDGAEVAVPSDPTNQARALLILASYDLIKLKEGVGFKATIDDVEENPHNLKFSEVDLLNLTSSYEDGVDLVFNYPTYIAKVGLTPDDALLLEKDPENTFAIQVVVREGNKDSEATKALLEAFTSKEVHEFLEKLAEKGHLLPAFDLN
ncbi:hypothetical protein KBI51_06850 [Aerococcaceae bacterium zg-ZUI334]|uniref:MetQ/NlpA family ABC transporter substrate-binding protein n=1 Tax=Aerococcaceae bacterium zg-252 TaxID=2796928 RepID=UPI001B9BDBB7|nr:hypothetical protein [Aerococcaceae bacterium zg-ZUI334]MBS4462358.1 hypothetical protein [Aerococcaceae bacterium zg-B36]